MVVGLIVYQHLFGPRETMFQVDLLRIQPHFTLPLGRPLLRSRYVIPLGGIIPSHRLTPSREENLLSV